MKKELKWHKVNTDRYSVHCASVSGGCLYVFHNANVNLWEASAGTHSGGFTKRITCVDFEAAKKQAQLLFMYERLGIDE